MLDTSLEIGAVMAAFLFAASGGELFLSGVLGTAKMLRLPRSLLATTLGAALTSAPELFVSIVAAGSGRPEIGLGDSLGSNVVNVGLVLGLVLLHRGLVVGAAERVPTIAALSAPVVVLLTLLDGHVSRTEGLLLLVLFASWVILGFRLSPRAPPDATAPTASGPAKVRSIVGLVAGVMLLLVAGRLFVYGAEGLAGRLGIDDYIIGATVVAIGTSLPELVTVIASRRRGQDDIGLGTVLGSNLFNGLAIVGVAATITPIDVPLAEVAVTLAFGWSSLLLILPRSDFIPRSRGIWLISTYLAHVATTVAITTAGKT